MDFQSKQPITTGEVFTESKTVKTTAIKSNVLENKNMVPDELKMVTTEIQEPKLEETNVNEKFKKEVYILNWVDYSTKYGIGYLLSNGAFGVYFNDTSKILSKDENFFYYIEKSKETLSDQLVEHNIYTCPTELQRKVKLMNLFKSYIAENSMV